MVTKGCVINKGLASVKFCDNFSPRLSITAVTVGKQVYGRQMWLRMVIIIWICRVTIKANALIAFIQWFNGYFIGMLIIINVTRSAKINHVSTKKLPIFLFLLYHNLQTTCTNKTKSLALLQNLMGFLLKFTETGYHIQSWRY